MSTETKRLSSRCCLITGAAQGIGHAIAERFAVEGARVIAADLRFGSLRSTDGVIEQVTLDVTDPDAVNRTAAAFPEVSVLVNCAGYVATGALLESSIEDFDRSININVRSMMLTIRAFLPGMLSRQQGSIINIASVVSSVMAAPQRF